jgi:hypothetical protein
MGKDPMPVFFHPLVNASLTFLQLSTLCNLCSRGKFFKQTEMKLQHRVIEGGGQAGVGFDVL